jgi:hypothetical protein
MQVNTNISTDAANRVQPPAPQAPPVKVAADSVNFNRTAHLERMLRDEKDVRAEEVERALSLVGQVSYPPQQTIRRIAALLAIEMPQKSEQP